MDHVVKLPGARTVNLSTWAQMISWKSIMCTYSSTWIDMQALTQDMPLVPEGCVVACTECVCSIL